MDDSNRVRGDASSPLAQYVCLLIDAPESLKLRLDRDSEAVRLLSDPALPEAVRRVGKRDQSRQYAERAGKKFVLTPRVWTRRDERRVNLQRGCVSGVQPECRAARYIRRVSPQADALFRAAVAEGREGDAAGAQVCGKLELACEPFQKLLDAARSMTQDDGGEAEFSHARQELAAAVSALRKWVKSPGKNSGKSPGLLSSFSSDQQAIVGYLTLSQLVEKYGVNKNRLDARLNRHRKVTLSVPPNHRDWGELETETRSDIRFLYLESAEIMRHINELRPPPA